MAEGGSRSNEERLVRFLKLGTERNFFLPGKNKLFPFHGNIMSIMLDEGQGKRAVECIKRVNAEKLYFKREPLLFLLAQVCHSSKDMEAKRAAYALINDICATPVDLFTWLKHVKNLAQFNKGRLSIHSMIEVCIYFFLLL